MTGIEALDQLAEEIMYTHNDGKTLTEYDSVRYDAIANDLKRLEKLEKVVEILNRTRISQRRIMYSKDYNDFQERSMCDYERILTQQEFDLLKEVFKNDN